MGSLEIIKGMEEINDILEQFNIRWFLAAGALLGIYRDKKLIPWDNDIDIFAVKKDFYKYYDDIVFMLSEYDYDIEYRSNGSRGMNLFKYDFCYSISLWKITEFDYYEFGQYRRLPKKFFNKLKKIEFNNKLYFCPEDIEGYLLYTYGENWKVPLKVNSCLECYTCNFDTRGKILK